LISVARIEELEVRFGATWFIEDWRFGKMGNRELGTGCI